MQKKKKSASTIFRRPVLIAAAVVVLIGIAGSAFLVKQRSDDNKQAVASKDDDKVRPIGSVDYGPPDPHDNDATNDSKGSQDGPDTLDGFPSDSSGKPSVTVTRADADNSSKTLSVAVLVDGVASGDCTLTASMNGASSLTRTSSVTAENNTASCGVFTIPYADFSANGKWKISVSVTSNGKTGSGDWPQTIQITK